jgi:ribosomal protein RSM22 (predicted rRNA methylase)
MVTLVDKDEELLSLAGRFLEIPHQLLCRSFLGFESTESVDLTLFSYSLGELHDWQTIIKKVLPLTQFLLIVEPGTPKGFSRLKEVRTFLLDEGLSLLAPCPHVKPCPLQEGNWCHFYARVQRRALQKEIKQGTLGFEDEKFSYLLFSKEPVVSEEGARLLRKPIVMPQQIDLVFCMPSGFEEPRTIFKKDPLFKKAKKWRWGDLIKS